MQGVAQGLRFADSGGVSGLAPSGRLDWRDGETDHASAAPVGGVNAVRLGILVGLVMLAIYTGFSFTWLSRAQAQGGPGLLTLGDIIVALVIPLLTACTLGVLLILQDRRAERERKAFADTEERYQTAVEAARCEASGNGPWTPTNSTCRTPWA